LYLHDSEQAMKKDWTLREALYIALHQWPSMVAFFALGCLLGWIASFFWPSYYRGTTQIYIGLNPYRAYSDSIFLALAQPKYGNVDDYKNWQMSQLDSIIYLDHFIDSTLAALRQQDPYWNAIDAGQLRDMLVADWRSAGTWDLNAEHREPQRASQAAAAWGQVIIENVQAAVEAARETSMIDQERQEIVTERIQIEQRAQAIQSAQAALTAWNVSALGIARASPDTTLTNPDRASLYAIVAQVSDFTPAWMSVLDAFPGHDATLPAYLAWAEQVLATINAELTLLGERYASLSAQSESLETQYNQVADASLGLSANIAIEGLEQLPARLIRPSSQFILVGGILAFLLWLVWQMMRIARKEYER
jgi:hypothetical protein